MKKRFYIDACLMVIGSSLLAIAVSLIYFLVDMKIDEGDSLLAFLGYATDFFNAIAVSIGYGTIIYAFFKFGFYEGIMSLAIYAGSFIPYYIYQVIAGYIYTVNGFSEYYATPEGAEAFQAVTMHINQAMGQGIINQILPAILVAFLACKIIKTSTAEPTSFFSWKNRLRRCMMVSAICLTVLNIIVFAITGILYELVSIDFMFFSSEEFSAFMGGCAISILEIIIVNLIMAYIIYVLVHKFYNYRLASLTSDEKSVKAANKITK